MVPPGRGSSRGISPVVGVALLVAIVVILAGLFGGLVLGVEMPDDPPPQYGYDTAYAADGAGNTNHRPYVNITITQGRIEVGEDFYVVDSDGNEVRWDQVWTTSDTLVAGDYAQIDGYASDAALNHACEGEVYRFVHRPDTGRSTVLIEVRIGRPATGPAAVHC